MDRTELNGLGKQIKLARNARGYTAEYLAERCNINSTFLRQIEGGKKLPSLPVFVNLCNALKISPDYLLRDHLEDNELSRISEIEALWAQASPDKLETVLIMIKALLSTNT